MAGLHIEQLQVKERHQAVVTRGQPDPMGLPGGSVEEYRSLPGEAPGRSDPPGRFEDSGNHASAGRTPLRFGK
ncbi:hypothetical protein [Paeniglutamicibacter cryotolerans]|uniref:Uncharacterized protein n=1 Tax=Paeniglutamicibacter cryotolerans TaxID=670079 RepID=A0A839QN94_9MICC|nr:hypothetical protein [Paeniglutamicibacter cryotolerans]MBB2996244.1 hypothetical protein [Paeniglutamicibacter cryotolerans]